MSGDPGFWLLLSGLVAAMIIMLTCRAHWYALLDAMHRIGPGMQDRLGWPREHPFNLPGLDRKPVTRKFPARRIRAQVMLRGLPCPELCPPAARAHARAFRLWGAVLLAELVVLGMIVISPWALVLAAALAALRYAMVPRWPSPGAGARTP